MIRPSVVGVLEGITPFEVSKMNADGQKAVTQIPEVSLRVPLPPPASGSSSFVCQVFLGRDGKLPFSIGDTVSLGVSRIEMTKYGEKVSANLRDCYLVKAGKG